MIEKQNYGVQVQTICKEFSMHYLSVQLVKSAVTLNLEDMPNMEGTAAGLNKNMSSTLAR